jgi:hypothetical protein
LRARSDVFFIICDEAFQLTGDFSMSILWLLSIILLWIVVLFLGFLLVGALRALGVLSWRLEQLEATTPKRLGRDGLKPGKRAPGFTLPCANVGRIFNPSGPIENPSYDAVVARSHDRATSPTEGLHDSAIAEGSGQETAPQPAKEVSLYDFLGRRVLLVFTQSGCSPCKKIIPELNRLGPDEQVIVVNNGDLEATRQWSANGVVISLSS